MALNCFGLSERALRQQRACHREHALLAFGVGRDRVEDFRKPAAAPGRRATSAVASSWATFMSSNAPESPRTTCDGIAGIVVALQHLHDDVRVQARGRDARFRMVASDLIRRLHGDDAGQMAEGGEHGGGLRGNHRRAVRGALRRHDGRAPARRSRADRPRWRAVAAAPTRPSSFWPVTIECTIDFQTSSCVRSDVLFLVFEDLREVDLLERDRGVSVLAATRPRGRRRAQRFAIERQHVQQLRDGVGRHRARRTSAAAGRDRAAAAPPRRSAECRGTGDALDHEAVGRDADGKHRVVGRTPGWRRARRSNDARTAGCSSG